MASSAAALFLEEDPLCCQEENWDVLEHQISDTSLSPAIDGSSSPATTDDGDWMEFLSSLLSKEDQFCYNKEEDEEEYRNERADACRWTAVARAAHGFSFPTLVLAVNYLDRCFAGRGGERGLKLRRARPWMGRLAAVACLSLAAKVEETWVPHPLDLQTSAAVFSSGAGAGEEYYFEPKTIRRMELLVLSALQWRMNPVTPLSFIQILVSKLSSNFINGGNLLKASEAALLSGLFDWRWLQYKPSELATAALLHAAVISGVVAVELESIQSYLLSILDTSKKRAEQCFKFMAESMAAATANGEGIGSCSNVVGNKRKSSWPSINCYSSYTGSEYSCPQSPDGVLNCCFSTSCESSTNSINGGDQQQQHWGNYLLHHPCSVTSSPQDEEYHHPLKKHNFMASNDEQE